MPFISYAGCQSINSLLPAKFLKSDPGRSFTDVYDPASCKPFLFQQILHGLIVLICVNSQIPTLGKSPIQAKGSHASLPGGSGNPVNHAIRRIIQPPAVIDTGIIRIRLTAEIKYAGDLSIRLTYIAAAFLDILPDNLLLRITVSPLIRIPIRLHKCPRLLI